MEKMRTLAFQVPEDLFEKIKEYLYRNNISQRQFVLGLIERELERELTQSKCLKPEQEKAGKGSVGSGNSRAVRNGARGIIR